MGIYVLAGIACNTNTKLLGNLAVLVAGAQAWKTRGIYFEKNFNWAAMDGDLIAAMDAGYNRIYVGFFMSLFGCQGACLQWASLDDVARQAVFAKATETGSKLYLSVGGEGEFAENVYKEGDTERFAQDAAEYALQQGYHGMDFNIHLAGLSSVASSFAESGEMVDYAETFVKIAKSVGWQSEDLTVTAHAPYFSPDFVGGDLDKSMSWLGLDMNSNEDFAVGDVSMMMFNEDQDYLTYEEMFIKNEFFNETDGTIGTGSAVQQILDLGISSGKVAIVKPIYEDGYSIYTGYVPPTTLSDWMCQAKDQVFSETNQNYWDGGYVMWTWNMNNQDTILWPSFLDESECPTSPNSTLIQ